jgi:hypothetical protein
MSERTTALVMIEGHGPRPLAPLTENGTAQVGFAYFIGKLRMCFANPVKSGSYSLLTFFRFFLILFKESYRSNLF